MKIGVCRILTQKSFDIGVVDKTPGLKNNTAHILMSYNIKKNQVSCKYITDLSKRQSITDHVHYIDRDSTNNDNDMFIQSSTSSINGQTATISIQFLVLDKVALEQLSRVERLMIGNFLVTAIRKDNMVSWYINKKGSSTHVADGNNYLINIPHGFYCVVYHCKYKDKHGEPRNKFKITCGTDFDFE